MSLRSDPAKMRRYKREWVANRRNKWFAENGPCVHCGSQENLELDHIDPAKKIHHGIWSWSKRRRNAELEKCQVLCRDCHVKKTWTVDFPSTPAIDLRPGKRHGSKHAYRTMGCRCDKCREWKSNDNRKALESRKKRRAA